ncbi:hypothetical protein K0U07_02085 [bacterium]|nr:hypothetical protein [bacterium]
MDPSFNRDGREVPRPIEPAHPEEAPPEEGSDGARRANNVRGRQAQVERPRAGNSLPARIQRASSWAIFRAGALARGAPGGGLAAHNLANVGMLLGKFFGAAGATRQGVMQRSQAALDHPSPEFSSMLEVAGELGEELASFSQQQKQLEKYGVLDKKEAEVPKDAMRKAVGETAKNLSTLMAKIFAKYPDIEKATLLELQEMHQEMQELEQTLAGMKKELSSTKEGKALLRGAQDHREKIAKKLSQFTSIKQGDVQGSSQGKVLRHIGKEIVAFAKQEGVDLPRLSKMMEAALEELESEGMAAGASLQGDRSEVTLIFKGMILAFQKMMMGPLPDYKQLSLSLQKLEGDMGKLVAALGGAAGKEVKVLAGMQKNFAVQMALRGGERNEANIQNAIAKRGVEGLWILKNRNPLSMLDVSEAMIEIHAQFDMCMEESDRLSSAGYNPEDILMILPKECRPEQMMLALEELAKALKHSIERMTSELENLHVEEATQAVSELYFAKTLSTSLSAHFPVWQGKFTELVDGPIQKIEQYIEGQG